MIKTRAFAALALAGALTMAASAAPAASASAPPAPIFVQFSPSATKGALYYPDPSIYPHPHVGVIAIHRNSNYLSHISTKELPKRGFVVLGMNPRCDNNEAACAPWENNALDVKQGVNYLRSLPGITTVVRPDDDLLPGGRGAGRGLLSAARQAHQVRRFPRRIAEG